MNKQKIFAASRNWKKASQELVTLAREFMLPPFRKSEILLAYGIAAYLAGPVNLISWNSILGMALTAAPFVKQTQNNTAIIDSQAVIKGLAILSFSAATMMIAGSFSLPSKSDEKALTAIAADKIRHGAHMAHECRDYKSGIGLGLGDKPWFRREDLFFCIDVVPAKNKDGYEVLSLQAYRHEKPGPQTTRHELSR